MKFSQLEGDRTKRLKQSFVCLWVEYANTSNVGVYKDRLKKNKEKQRQQASLIQSGDRGQSCESRRMIRVFSARRDRLSFKHKRLHPPLVTSQRSGNRKVRRSTQHHQHRTWTLNATRQQVGQPFCHVGSPQLPITTCSCLIIYRLHRWGSSWVSQPVKHSQPMRVL